MESTQHLQALEQGAGPARLARGPRIPPGAAPLALVPALVVLGALAIGDLPTWLTLTVAGLAMGLIIFIVSSGLTLVFGLMDVVNFGHGLFLAVGAYVAATVLMPMAAFTNSDQLWMNLVAVGAAALVAATAAAVLGLAFERLVIRPVYGQHLKQILITMGAMVVGEELIRVFWGIDPLSVPMPAALQGAVLLGDAALEKYRLIAILVGIAVFVAIVRVLNGTKLGLLIRASVQDREMVESLGYPVKYLFVLVFVAGSALAGLGGVMWAIYAQTVVPTIGGQFTVLIFVVLVIGGLGSTGGCFLAALLVGLMANYVGFLYPRLTGFSTMLLMTAVLLWRPQGLYAVRNT